MGGPEARRVSDMLAETFVLLLVILFPELSSWIPTYFLG
jgi:hypothetical protein